MVGHVFARIALGTDDQDGVVAGDGPHDLGQARPIEGRGHDVGRPGRRAQDHEIVAVIGLHHEFPHDPTEMVLGHHPVVGMLGDRIGHGATGDADLDRAELLEVAAHRGLGGDDPFRGHELEELLLAGDHLLLEETGDPDSLLSHYRSLIALRAAHPALSVTGSLTTLASSVKGVYAVLRHDAATGESIVVISNLSKEPVTDIRLSLLDGPLCGTPAAAVAFESPAGVPEPPEGLVINAAGGFDGWLIGTMAPHQDLIVTLK